ncbi:hypothetical protein JG688_00012623 [Phytophthora aleatoria]|uniref:Uncharacterized protein n=1 Tax=Phytophthora aleatoria TaxID=2496075 RepID=A0A8J5IIY2_9STRA|nr:hypothetical protein JG688_00012623 [Phytophthora aleatoria]
MTEVWRVVCVNASMLSTSLKMYQVALRSPRLQKLPGSTCAFALWGGVNFRAGSGLEEKQGHVRQIRQDDTCMVDGCEYYILRLPAWCGHEDEGVCD